MLKCEMCSAKEGAPVRLSAGDTVPRQLYRCSSCKTIICNGCLHQEYIVQKRASRNPLKIFSDLISGTNSEMGFVQMQCPICNNVVDMDADRTAAEVT
jgi:hypothetical protein